VLTHFPPVDTYNAEITPAEIAHSVTNFRDHRWSGASLMPFGHGDGGGGPTPGMVERAHRLHASDPRWTLELGTPADFFAHVEREIARGAPVPVWRGELYFEMHRGSLTSQLRTKTGNRRCERLLVEAELWAAATGRPADLDESWREVLTQQFHDVLPGSSISWVHADAEAVFDQVGGELERRIADRLEALLPPGGWLANPADVPVDGVVLLDRSVEGLVEGAGPVQALADGRVAVAAAVPALGVAPASAAPVEDRVRVTGSAMVNRHLAVRWDERGTLSSVIDLRHAREIVPAGATAAVLELAPDHPVEYDAWDLEAWTRAVGRPVVGEVELEVVDAGPLVGRVAVRTTFGPSSATVTYELRAGAPELLVHVDLDWHHDEHLLSMAFPLDVRADTAACDVQFGVVHRPTHPSTPWDAAKYEVCAHRFVDVTEPGFGVAVLNDGRYGHCLFGGAVRVSLARAAKYPDPTADHGRHSVTLALLPHGADRAAVRAAAARLNRPVRVIRVPPVDRAASDAPASTTGLTPPPASVVRLDGPRAAGVEIDAVKLADDGSGDLVVRLHEALGDRAAITVSGPQRIVDAWRCDLLEDPVSGEDVGDGVVVVTLRPFELVTLRLRRGPGTDGRDTRR